MRKLLRWTRISTASLKTARLTAFIGLLAVLEQNAGAAWQELLKHTSVAADRELDADGVSDELVNLTL